jgi:hypothetical protein
MIAAAARRKQARRQIGYSSGNAYRAEMPAQGDYRE